MEGADGTNQAKYKLTYFDARGVAEPTRFIFAYAGVPFEDERIPREDWPSMKEDTPFGQLPYLEIDGKKFGQSAAFARLLAKRFGLAGKDEIEQAHADAVVDYNKGSLGILGDPVIVCTVIPRPTRSWESCFLLCDTGYVITLIVDDHPDFAMCDSFVPSEPNLDFPKEETILTDIQAAMAIWWREEDKDKQTRLREKFFKEDLRRYLSNLERLLKASGDGQFFTASGPSFADFYIATFFFTIQKFYPNILDNYDALKGHGDRVHKLPGIKEWVEKRPKTEM